MVAYATPQLSLNYDNLWNKETPKVSQSQSPINGCDLALPLGTDSVYKFVCWRVRLIVDIYSCSHCCHRGHLTVLGLAVIVKRENHSQR